MRADLLDLYTELKTDEQPKPIGECYQDVAPRMHQASRPLFIRLGQGWVGRDNTQ